MCSKKFDREKLLINKSQFNKINNSKIAVFGIGGVGGYVCEMLARAGVKTLLLCDFDKVDETNINRQIIAYENSVGNFKVDEMEKRLKSINSSIEIIKVVDAVSENNIDKFNLSTFDYVVDAIDDIPNKLVLIEHCKQNNINIISSMGAGNKVCIPNYIVTDIFKTKYDKLAKIIRQKCREKGIKKLDVCYMETDRIISNGEKVIGSISYHPCVCGAVISSFVVNKLINI